MSLQINSEDVPLHRATPRYAQDATELRAYSIGRLKRFKQVVYSLQGSDTQRPNVP